MIVSRWSPVRRSVDRIEQPSTRQFKANTALLLADSHAA